MPTTICDLATKLPKLVANLLDRESKLKRGRFREETLTDIFTGALAAFVGPELVIEYPPEAATGGDIDLEFWHVSSGRRLLLRIQAKRLNAGRNAGKAVAIKHRAYNELLHQVPKKTGLYQFDTLVKQCGPFLPLYMFYNHGEAVRASNFGSPGPTVGGINLAFASDIADEMETKLAAWPKRLHHKRLSHLRKHFFALEAILCPPGDWDGGVPSPDVVSESLERAWNKVGVDQAELSDVEVVTRKFKQPASIGTRHDPDRRLPDGPAIRLNRALKRPIVTFMSARTDDDRTPRISDDASDTGD
jgi:hypothetical protein